MALPRRGTARYRNRQSVALRAQTPGFVQRLVDPTMGGTRNATWSQRFLSATYRGVIGSSVAAAGEQPDFMTPYGSPGGTSMEGGSGRAAAAENELAQGLAPLNKIATHIADIAGGVNQIIKLLTGGVGEDSAPTNEVSTADDNTNRAVPRESVTNNYIVDEDGNVQSPAKAEKKPGPMAEYLERTVGAFRKKEPVVEPEATVVKTVQPANKNDSEPGSTGGYQQHEKDEKQSDSVEVRAFGDGAMKQLGELFDKLGKQNEGGGINLPSLPAVPRLKLNNPFRRKPKTAKATAGKLPANKQARAAAQTRGPDGRFVKAAPGAANPTQSGLGKVGSAMRGAVNNPKVLGVTRGAGLIAAPLVAGLDYMGRKKEGQTNTQAAIGAGGGLAGAAAGGFVGAEAGAIVGGGIGALFGGVGAVPGAAIGGVVGGVGGAIAGSGVGGWVADKFTGADKPKAAKIVPKQFGPTPQTKDMIALEKTRKRKEEEKRTPPPPPMVNAPTTNTTVVNQNQQLMSGGGSSRGPRGSLDLSKY